MNPGFQQNKQFFSGIDFLSLCFMELVKRNSAEFNLVKDIFEVYIRSRSAKKLIKLYSVKPSQKLDEATLVNTVKKNADAVFNLFYLSVVEYLKDKSKKLFRKDNKALYYFKSSSSSRWIEFPFELTGKLKNKVLKRK